VHSEIDDEIINKYTTTNQLSFQLKMYSASRYVILGLFVEVH